MISAHAKLSIREIPLECIQCVQHEPRYVEQLLTYVDMLHKHPDRYAGLLHVAPSQTHQDMFALLDGYHRFCASIMAGRDHALCVVVEDGGHCDCSR